MTELQMVLEAVQGLGAEAKSAFICWLAYKAFHVLVVAGIWAIVSSVVFRLIKHAINLGSFANAAAKAMGYPYGVPEYGQSRLIRDIHSMVERTQYQARKP